LPIAVGKYLRLTHRNSDTPSRIENGKANPSLNAIEVIANGLGMDVFEFFNHMKKQSTM
jgi:transcriptional regulator with XRE-family HTH domain